MRGRVRTQSEVGRSRPGKPPLSGESDPVAESGGQALGRRRGRKGLHPSSRGGRAQPSSVADLVEAGRFRGPRPRLQPPLRSGRGASGVGDATIVILKISFKIIINARRSCPAGRVATVGGNSLAAATGARDCTPPAVAGARGAPLQSTNPATTGCPGGGGRRSHPCESRGEWRGHSSGRRVVAASVPGASALAAEYQPGYDGLPGGAQGLRALRIDHDWDYDFVQPQSCD